ncbi:hypothetical protein [Pedobacter sp. NJ-S-72]
MTCLVIWDIFAQQNTKIMQMSLITRQIIFILAALCCLFPLMSPPLALLLGLVIAQIMEHPFLHLNHKATNWLLKLAVIGLGFGMNLSFALKAGKEGFLFTIASIFGVLTLGFILVKYSKLSVKLLF